MDEEQLQPIDICKVLARSYLPTCQICRFSGRKNGATVSCAFEKCRAQMLVTCAQSQNWLREQVTTNSIAYSVYCERHISSQPGKRLSMLNITSHFMARRNVSGPGAPFDIEKAAEQQMNIPDKQIEADDKLEQAGPIEYSFNSPVIEVIIIVVLCVFL